MKNQTVKVKLLDNGNITAMVTDVYENDIHNYDWVLQNITLETAKELLKKLEAAIIIANLL